MNETCKQLVYRFLDELKRTYYTTSSICQYQKPLEELLTYCEEKGIESYTPEVAESYIIDVFKNTANNDISKLQLYARALNMLTYFQRNDVVPYRCAYTEYHFPEWFYPVYQEFVEDRRYRNLKENTIKKQHRSFEKLGQYLDRNGITSFDMLNINILQQYVSSISELSLAVSYNAVSALRMFLGFLYDRKYISINFKEFIPNVKYSHKSHKRALGLQYDRPEYELVRFSEFLVENNVNQCEINKNIAEKWCERRPDESNKTWHYRHCIYRQFAIFLHSRGYSAHIPPVPKKYTSTYVPHIFTQDEIRCIYKATDSFKFKRSSSYQTIMPPLVRLLFATGLRISEAVNLKYSDVNLSEGILYIYESKNNDSRLVPMDNTLTQYLLEYNNDCDSERTFFFETKRHCQISVNTCYKVFRDILFKAGIPHEGRGKGPRLHDIRHTFAVISLQHMIKQGMDIYVSLPYLSAYMGHKSVKATEKYIRLANEAYPELENIINNYTGHVVPEVVS